MTIEKFPGHFAFSNGTRRNQQNALAGYPKDRIQNLKYAIFYLLAAIILFLANRVSTQHASPALYCLLTDCRAETKGKHVSQLQGRLGTHKATRRS